MKKLLKLIAIGLVAANINSINAQTLLLRYNFDEASSGNADATDSGQSPAASGVFQGSATRSSDTPGGFSTGSLDVSTSALTDYISGGDADKLDGVSQMTFACWLKLTANPSFADRILGKFAPGTFDGFDWTISVASAPEFRMNVVVGNGGSALASSVNTLNAEQRWVFLAATYDGTSAADNVKFYMGDETNTVVELNVATLDKGTPVANDADFRVASTAASASDRTPPALIDDVRVYSGILALEDLETIRQANLPASTPPATAVQILSPNVSSGDFTFSFETQNGHTHTVEYKTNLNDVAWQTLTTVTGDGSTTNITHSAAGASARFYRVSTE